MFKILNQDNSSGGDESQDHSALQESEQDCGKNKDDDSQKDTDQDGSLKGH